MIRSALLTTTSTSYPSPSPFPSQSPPNPNPYIYKIVPVNPTNHTTPHIAAISSSDSLRLLDARTLRDINIKPIPNPVHDGVTCLQGSGGDGGGGEGRGLVWTAGRDGVVREFDLRVGQEMKMVMELSSSDG